MTALHLTTLRYIALLELLAIYEITTFFWVHDCRTWQYLLVQLRATIQGDRGRHFWDVCMELLEPFNAAVYLLEGDNEFVFDLLQCKLSLRSIQIVLRSHVILDDSTFHELINILYDIKDGYLSIQHKADKLYRVRSKHPMVVMYSQEV